MVSVSQNLVNLLASHLDIERQYLRARHHHLAGGKA